MGGKITFLLHAFKYNGGQAGVTPRGNNNHGGRGSGNARGKGRKVSSYQKSQNTMVCKVVVEQSSSSSEKETETAALCSTYTVDNDDAYVRCIYFGLRYRIISRDFESQIELGTFLVSKF